MLCYPELRSSWTDTSPRTGHTGQTAEISLLPTDASCFSAQRAQALRTSYRQGRNEIKLKLGVLSERPIQRVDSRYGCLQQRMQRLVDCNLAGWKRTHPAS